MADAAVEILLNNLKDLHLYHSHLITNIKGQIESLETDLHLFNAFIKDTLRMLRKDEHMKVLVRDIRDVVYAVEDVIDDFVFTQSMEKKAKSSSVRLRMPSLDLHNVSKKVEAVRIRVEKAKIDVAELSINDEDKKGKIEVRPPRQKDMVGFPDVMDDLIARLTEETDYFDVVSLIGMFGLGKTTLARKIFNDPRIVSKFPTRIWLPISQQFSKRDIFLAILKRFTNIDHELRSKDGIQLAQIVADYLERDSFLIVLDDVWSAADWDILRVAMPANNNKGKILITSRIEEVGRYASRPRMHYQLRCFTEDESWALLRLEALGKLDCPLQLEDVGKMIAVYCGGLPLLIVAIGGILAIKYSPSNLSKTRKAWEDVSTWAVTYFNKYDPEDDHRSRMKKFIWLNYDMLPYHLRACFLYLGLFPEDYEIPVSKLIRMWIGEGFIQQNNDRSLEETGLIYLEDLINRNLVATGKLKPNGKVKTCSMHDILREFCQTVAGSENENFLHEIKFHCGEWLPPISNLHEYRRLSIHSNCLEFIASKSIGPLVRSFVCFSKYPYTLPSEYIPPLLSTFKLLRVLEAKPLRFTQLNPLIYQMINARYISMTLELSTLPSNFGLLCRTQTLIVDTTAHTLEVKLDIWKLSELRHFKTNVPTILPMPTKDSKHGVELQTLGTISVESCTAKLFERACNLKKLGIRGQLALLMEGRNGYLDSLRKVKYLEKLKLVNDVYPNPILEGRLRSFPQPSQFPSNLKSLTLVATYLSWNFMSIVGLLKNLEVLKLKEKAFMGYIWKVVDGGFRHLEFLQIEETDLTFWEASRYHFPRLKGLVLKNCEKLLAIPIGLADVESFHMLELHECKYAAASAKKINEAKEKNKNKMKRKTQVQRSLFELSIFPPTD